MQACIDILSKLYVLYSSFNISIFVTPLVPQNGDKVSTARPAFAGQHHLSIFGILYILTTYYKISAWFRPTPDGASLQ
jgi:hypothetical protein